MRKSSNIIFILVLVSSLSIYQATAQQSQTAQSAQTLCNETASLRAKLERQLSQLERVNTTVVQSDIDRYKVARQYMRDALDILFPLKSLFIQKKQKKQLTIQSSNSKSIQSSIFSETGKIQSVCGRYMSFGTKAFNKACVAFEQLQQNSGQVNYCSLAQTYASEAARRQRPAEFDEQLVCQTVYTVELMGQIQGFLQSVLNDTRFDQLNAALQQVINSQTAQGCIVVQERQVLYYKSVGPYKDTGDRALRYGPKKDGYNSETCSQACAGYKYFSLQMKGECYCDNDFSSVTKYGPSQCGQLGDSWCNYVYQQFNISASTLNSSNSIVPIGPYRDTDDRAFRYGPKQYGYNIETCAKACEQYTFFALQDNGWCSCENDFTSATKHGTSSCGQLGGSWCNYIYKRLK